MPAHASGSLTANLLELMPNRSNNGSLSNADNAGRRRQTLEFTNSHFGLARGISRAAKSQKEPNHPGFKVWLSTVPIITSLLRSDRAREFLCIIAVADSMINNLCA